nr:RNA-dependent DNA polymerase [Ardenticatenales bacterium]
AFQKAARGKRGKVTVATFEYDLEQNLFALQQELQTGSYHPGPYSNFYIHDPKRRLISAAPFRDRVVHHALVNIMDPIWERRFIFDSYANRVGKGTHRALDRCTHFMRRFQYVLPLDVRQFFPSIDHELLLITLRRVLADKSAMSLAALILKSGEGVFQEEYEMVFFPSDGPEAHQRPRGLPIGNMTSQFWANVYLNELDHFIKRALGCRGYLRYVDDLLLFADDKATLHHWRAEVLDYLASLRLTAHESRAQVRPTHTGVPFLGFQVFPDHRRLKRRNVVKAGRRLKALRRTYTTGEIELPQVRASIHSWIAHVAHGDTWGLRRALLGRTIFSRA